MVSEGDTVVDATCGNGNDSVILLKKLNLNGKLYAFDIQESAIEATKSLIIKYLNTTTKDNLIFKEKTRNHYYLKYSELCEINIIKDTHSKMTRYIKREDHNVKLICFNLGYLPGSKNKQIKTEAMETIEGLKASLECIRGAGMISVMSYVGHEGGEWEYQKIKEFLLKIELNSNYLNKYVCQEIKILNRQNAPILINITKLI